MSLSALNPQSSKLFSLLPTPSLSTTHKLSPPNTLKLSRKLHTISSSFNSSYSTQTQTPHFEEDHVVGDCVVFEDGVFDDPFLQNDVQVETTPSPQKAKPRKAVDEIATENLVPEQWREVQAEVNITKKERRKIAQELQFGTRVEKNRKGLEPIREVNLQEYEAFKKAKLNQLRPEKLEYDDDDDEDEDNAEEGEGNDGFVSERVKPKNPRWAVYGKGLEDVTEFFNSGHYEPGVKRPDGPRKLFTKEEKLLLNRRKPDIAAATSGDWCLLALPRFRISDWMNSFQRKWLPLHTLAASGDYYLMEALLKHNADISAVDMVGWTALHKAVVCKNHAITNLLLRESANPFARDDDGATLMHYAVRAASGTAIKTLLLYNVDINISDNDGWTPLHLAVQGRRPEIVRLLLVKGADKTLRNKDGLTPLDICLYSGRDLRTYELIKLLKLLPKTR